MKKLLIALLLLLSLSAFSLTACTPSGPSSEKESESISKVESETPSNQYTVVAKQSEITVKDEEVENIVYKDLFEIRKNGQIINASATFTEEYFDGGIIVTCTYNGLSATVTITVEITVYTLDLSVEKITLGLSQLEGYDFNALFSATKDGGVLQITPDMVASDVKAQVGVYEYTVTAGDIVKTLTVEVVDHVVEVVKTYPDFQIEIGKIPSFDATVLFALYVDGQAVKVTADMVDASALSSALVGESYSVVLNATFGETSISETATVTVKENSQTVINAKNVITYPNGEFIDLTTLFEITSGNQVVPVTADMVSGSIDYSQVGINVVTLTYLGEQYTATVEVKRGVIINYTTSDTVIIKKGTNANSYPFANDFKVIVNGIRFTAIDGYIDSRAVDFTTAGEYTATIRVPYNDKNLSISGVNFTYFESQITYVVVEYDYSLTVKEEVVTLSQTATSYDVFSNVKLTINGKNQTFTDIKSYVDPITCYAEVLSEPIDFSSSAVQNVRIALYVYGVDSNPVIAEYSLIIKSSVEVVGGGAVVFTGATVYTKDLFTVIENGEEVEVTYDMISGKVDVFTPGLYVVTLDYKGHIAEAKVTVLDGEIIGTYRTLLTTIAETSADDDEDYGVTPSGTRVLRNLFYYEDGSIVVDGANATVKGVVNETVTEVEFYRNKYVMYYDNGIIVLDPDNSIKLPYTNEKRPMIYFHNGKWNLQERIVINSSSSYVLSNTITCYSLDIFKITDMETGEDFYYALKVALIDKSGTDTVYEVTHGFVEFDGGEVPQVGVQSTLTLNGEKYKFTMDSASSGSIKKPSSSDKKYVSMVFNGQIDGQDAILRSDTYEGFTLQIGGVVQFKVGSMEVSEMKNGGPDYDTDTVILYGHDKNDEGIFSYKFHLDLENKTFTVDDKDVYFGLYETDGAYIFIDGYGKGVVNFDTKSYYRYSFEYTVTGNKMDIQFVNVPYDFAYGQRATLFVDPLLNVLSVNYIENSTLMGKKLINAKILDGAVVEISSYKVGADSDAIAKAKLLEGIKIITKDGELTGSAKTSAIDTKKIRFSVPGFYQFTITVSVGGQNVVSYYAVQVLAPIYEGNPVVNNYGGGIINESHTLNIDKYGQATLVVNGVKYDGTVKINEDNSYAITAEDKSGATISANGKLLANGLIEFKCSGAVAFNDYYTSGQVAYAGAEKIAIRRIYAFGEYTYIVAPNSGSFGGVAEVELISGTLHAVGSVMKMTVDGEVHYVKVETFGDRENATKGVVLADEYRGTFLLEDGTSITLDGFGTFTADKVGSYVLEGRIATVNVGGQFSVYRLDNVNWTAQLLDIKFDASLVIGKNFTAEYNFFCDNYPYLAYTTFEFKANGVVVVKSTSAEHDDGSEYTDACIDTYAPPFASAVGVSGVYSVSVNKITVQVNGYTIVFEMPNVVTGDVLKCISTTIENSAHGFFDKGTTFVVE